MMVVECRNIGGIVMPMTDADQQKAVAVALVTAIAERDRATVSSCLSEEVVWWVPQSAAALGLPRPLRGRQATLGLLCGESRYQVGTMQWDHHHLLHDGAMVAVHSTLRATTNLGVAYENQYVNLYRFDGRQIVEGWEHTDTSYAFSRLSMVTPGPS
jgi:ketosteroid isomerase-like protein